MRDRRVTGFTQRIHGQSGFAEGHHDLSTLIIAGPFQSARSLQPVICVERCHALILPAFLSLLLPYGAILVLAGMAIIGLIDNFVVEIAKYAGLWQFHFVRALMALPMLVVIGLLMGLALLPQRYWAVGLRSLLLAASMMLYFGSIPSMPIVLVIAGMFTSPVFVLIFSRLLFGVQVGRVRILAVAVGFIGVLMVLNPFGEAFTWLGWTFVQAIGSIVGVGLLTRAYQSTETTYLVVYEYSLLLFASFWAFVFYGQTVGGLAILGMGLIVVSGTIIALRSPAVEAN